jgi:hypothetical protein
LSYATTSYLIIVAYNDVGLESLPSNQVSYATALLGAQRLTVGKGTGSGEYAPGTQVLVTASPPSGQEFERWIGDYQILLVPEAQTTTAMIPFKT